MNKEPSLPSTKKRRISRISCNVDQDAHESKFDLFETNKNCDRIAPFEWTDNKINLISFGMTRKYSKYAVPDISSIIIIYLKNMLINYHINNNNYSKIKYMSNNTFLCNFYFNNTKHYYSTIIFTPFISNIFNNIKSKS